MGGGYPGEPYLLTPALPGDANLDGKVDINDLTIVLAHYGQTGMAWTEGEFTGDGTVDINDLTIVLAHYNQSLGSSAGIAAVPGAFHAGADRHWPGQFAQLCVAAWDTVKRQSFGGTVDCRNPTSLSEGLGGWGVAA